MPRLMRTLGAVAALLLMVPALAAAGSPTRIAGGAKGFWAVTVPGESFASTVGGAMGASPQRVTGTIEGMVKRAKAGKPVLVPEGTRGGVHMVPAQLTQLQAALAATSKAAADDRAAGSAGRVARIPDPHDFKIRGNGCHPVTWRGQRYWASWCKVPFQLDGEHCDETGCKITDVIKLTLLVDPGTHTSRVTRKSTYKYPAGNPHFKHIHIEWYTFCFNSEQECGTSNTEDFFGNSSGTFNPTSSRDLHNSRIRHAFVFWAFFGPSGMWTPDYAKTWKGICKPRSSNSNQCLYPA